MRSDPTRVCRHYKRYDSSFIQFFYYIIGPVRYQKAIYGIMTVKLKMGWEFVYILRPHNMYWHVPHKRRKTGLFLKIHSLLIKVASANQTKTIISWCDFISHGNDFNLTNEGSIYNDDFASVPATSQSGNIQVTSSFLKLSRLGKSNF